MTTDYNPFNNEDFRKEFQSTLTRSLTPVNDLLAQHSADIKENKDAIDNHEKFIQRGKGGFWVLQGLWAIVIGLFEYVMHAKR